MQMLSQAIVTRYLGGVWDDDRDIEMKCDIYEKIVNNKLIDRVTDAFMHQVEDQTGRRWRRPRRDSGVDQTGSCCNVVGCKCTANGNLSREDENTKEIHPDVILIHY